MLSAPLSKFRGYATKNSPRETPPGAAERNFSPGGPISGTKAPEKGLLILRRGSGRPRPAASRPGQGACFTTRNPEPQRGPPAAAAAAHAGPGTATRAHWEAPEAKKQERGSESAKQGPDTRTGRRPRDPRPRDPHGLGRGEEYGPEHIRGDGRRAGGHQRQEGGGPKPPQAEEAARNVGGRRTGGQAAATAAAAPRQAAGGPRHRDLSSVRNKPPFANSCRPNFRPVGMGPAGREAKKQG